MTDSRPANIILRLTGQLTRFGIVGVVATMVHLGIAGVVLAFYPGTSPFLANLVAFIVAFQVSFWGHSRFTFREQGRRVRFLLVTLMGFGINNGALLIFTNLELMDDFTAICLSVTAVPVFVFLASRLWVFTGKF